MRKRFDWATWRDGLKAKLVEAAGTSIVTLFGSNGVAALNIPGLQGIGMNWKTAIVQFSLHLLVAAGLYMRDQKPAVIEETYETTFTTKNPATGETTTQASKTVTNTPVQDPKI